MSTAESLARFAGLLADRSRATICLALLDGRAWTAGELATHAGVARSTASEHLTVLVEAGLLAEARQGRHRYLRLAGPQIAQLVEDLAGALGEPERPVSLRTVRVARRMSHARTCYDHLAGGLGVGVFDALVERGLLAATDGLAVTAAGRVWFTAFAGETALHPPGRRPLLRTCLDWTERRPHLSGALGAALCDQVVRRGWVVRHPGSRALTVTPAGSRALSEHLGVRLEPRDGRAAVRHVG